MVERIIRGDFSNKGGWADVRSTYLFSNPSYDNCCPTWGIDSGKVYINYQCGNSSKAPASDPFKTQPLSNEGAMVNGNLDEASNYLYQVSLKAFNPSVGQGRVLNGIFFFDVKEPMIIESAVLNLNGNNVVKVGGNKEPDQILPGKSLKKPVVTNSGGHEITRSQYTYKKQTEDFSSPPIYMTDNPPKDSDNLKPFDGPITLPIGTHAIPWSFRLPDDMSPTGKVVGKNKRHSGEMNHINELSADVVVRPKSAGGSQATVKPGKIPIDVISTGSLPAVVNGQYTPADVRVVDIPAKNAKAIIVLEKTDLEQPDTIRMHVYANAPKAVKDVSAELVKTTDFPELDLSVADPLADPRKNQGIDVLAKSRSQKLSSRYPKKFSSTIGNKFPPDASNKPSSGPIMDDKSLLSEADRVEGALIELKIPSGTNPTISETGYKNQYYALVHIKMRKTKNPADLAIPITISKQIVPNNN